MGLIKDAIVAITRSVLGGFLFSAFRHKQKSEREKIILNQTTSKNIPDDDDGGGPPPPPRKIL